MSRKKFTEADVAAFNIIRVDANYRNCKRGCFTADAVRDAPGQPEVWRFTVKYTMRPTDHDDDRLLFTGTAWLGDLTDDALKVAEEEARRLAFKAARELLEDIELMMAEHT